MQNFKFHIPTKIIFGDGEIGKLSDNINEVYRKILIVTDKNAGEKSGALNAIQLQLSDRELIVFDEVEENPSFATLEKGKKIATENKIQMILGVGGGSPMDAAKGIAVLAVNDGDMKEYMKGKKLLHDPLPIVCIPTTSGTGSEATPYAVFTDPEDYTKGGYAHPKIFPSFSIIDPELTYSMPESVVINTGLDALTHSIEAYLSTQAFPMNDLLAIESIQVVLKHLKEASQKDKSAMNELSYASMLGGIAITHASTILLHIMAYPLTVFHNIPHGKANAILLPEFMNFMRDNSTVKAKVAFIDSLFKDCGGIETYVEGFNISTCLSGYGIPRDEIEMFVKKTIVKGDVKITPAKVTEDTIADIYLAAL